jgi:hypothetical protein
MTLAPPPFIPQQVLQDPTIRYTWDDWNRAEIYDWVDEDIEGEWDDLSEQALAALAIAIAEWIIFRLVRFDDDPTPLQALEAAWCANVDRRYSEGLEVSTPNWLGPVRGPLGLAINLLQSALYLTLEDQEEPAELPAVLSNLAEHVCGMQADFRHWRSQCVARLRLYYRATQPVDDLFDEATRMQVVPREAFDLSSPFDLEKSAALIDRFLRQVDYQANPFLQTPEEMFEDGFEGAPYTFFIAPA